MKKRKESDEEYISRYFFCFFLFFFFRWILPPSKRIPNFPNTQSFKERSCCFCSGSSTDPCSERREEKRKKEKTCLKKSRAMKMKEKREKSIFPLRFSRCFQRVFKTKKSNIGVAKIIRRKLARFLPSNQIRNMDLFRGSVLKTSQGSRLFSHFSLICLHVLLAYSPPYYVRYVSFKWFPETRTRTKTFFIRTHNITSSIRNTTYVHNSPALYTSVLVHMECSTRSTVYMRACLSDAEWIALCIKTGQVYYYIRILCQITQFQETNNCLAIVKCVSLDSPSFVLLSYNTSYRCLTSSFYFRTYNETGRIQRDTPSQLMHVYTGSFS